jgi:hypothetical protein
MKKQISLLLLCALLGLGQSAFAVDYYWRFYEQPASITTKYADPTSACQAYIAYRKSVNNPDTIWIIKAVTKQTVSVYGCNIDWRTPPSTNFLNATVPMTRVGDTCATGSTYNPNTGLCDVKVDPCKEQIGQKQQISSDTPQYEFCMNSCLWAAVASSDGSDDSGKMYTSKKAAEQKVFYTYTVENEGVSCPVSSAPADTNATAPAPSTSAKSTDCTPTTTGSDGSQSSECTTTKTEIDNAKCVAAGGYYGSVDGVNRCVASGKGPTAEKNEVTTKVKTETNADGSTKTTTTTTNNTTTCAGSKACTTTTTTTTNVSHTNADGTKGSESSTCTGAKCSGSSSNPDGSDEEGEEEEGDDIAGPSGTLAGKQVKGFGEALTEWDTKIADGREQLDGLIDQYSGLFSGVFDLNLGTGGGELPCYNIPINVPKFQTTLKFCPADYEDKLIYLKYILLACAAILAGFIILRD